MSKLTDTHVQAAKRLILAAQASCASGSAEAQEAAVSHMSGAIDRAFSPVIGTAGVGALFARSVKLTRANFPGLGTITMDSDGSRDLPEHLSNCMGQLESSEALELATGLYAAFFALITNLIGEPLVWKIMERAFPKLRETRSDETK